MSFRFKVIVLALAVSGYTSFHALASVNLAETSQIITINATPNILLIPDTSETMQEGLSQGRIALDWESGNCKPGTNMPASCVAGAKHVNSKASIVKRVSLNLVDSFTGKVNMGLLSYQQYPPSQSRDDVFDEINPRSVLWFLTHRPLDIRYDTIANPTWYDPNHTQGLNSSIKRFREPHPTVSGAWIFYNDAVPGYYRDVFDIYHPPQTSRNQFAQAEDNYSCNEIDCRDYRLYNDMLTYGGTLSYYNQEGDTWRITFTDSMRGRGITDLGKAMAFLNTRQLEWRANASPGPGYLHVPIGGIGDDGKPIASHWQAIKNKLKPQRTDWNGFDSDIFTNASWPLIAAGLKPLEGTMFTARDYFLNQTTSYFGANQGNTGINLPAIPESCGNNAAIWITDGLPSVAANGTALGRNPVNAMVQARDAIKDFYDKTAAAPALKGAVKTYIVGFALPPGVRQLFEKESWFPASGNVLDYLAEAGGTNQAYSATDEASLLMALENIFQNIIRDSISSTGIASSSTELSTDTKIFQSELNTINWSGDLVALNIVGANRLRSNPAWRASVKLTELGHSNRKIFSNLGTAKFEFTTAATPTAAKDLLRASNETETTANNRIDYIRGDRSNEGSGAGKLRERAGILGHIINSTPLYIPGQGSRPPMLYIMANDGMLHGFHAETGAELFAYIPGAVLPKYLRYTSGNYAGEYMLDGQLTYREINGQIILAGTAGTGVKSVFALNVTNPANFNTSNILWEVSGNTAFGGRLGFTGSQPITAMYNNRPAVIIGNGYNSQQNRSSLLVIDLENGALLKSFDQAGLGFGSPGGIDLNRNNNADFVYVGDFNGKLWRFTLNNGVISGLSESLHLFSAENSRPLVVAPVAASHPDGGVMVIFGTGELLTTSSRTSTSPEFVYAIHDLFDTSRSSAITDSQLVKHQITNSNTRTLTTGLTDNNKMGWRVQLPGGERMLANAVVRRQKVIFGSYKPDNTPCSGGGQGYMTELNLLRGSKTSTTQPPSKPVLGIPRTPIFIEIPKGGSKTDPNCTEDCSYISDENELILIGEQDELQTVIKGRQLWREIGR